MNKLTQVKRSSVIRCSIASLALGLSACGPSDDSRLSERIDIDSGVYSRHSIIERDGNIEAASAHGRLTGLSYFPTTLPKGKYGEDIFWTFFPDVKFKIAHDPDKWFPDNKLLEATVPAQASALQGTYFHNDLDLLYETNSAWRVEFRPFFKIKASFDSNESISLGLMDQHVCARISEDVLTVLDEKRTSIKSEGVKLGRKFQDLRLSHAVDSLWYKPFRESCEQAGGFVASSLEISLSGGEHLPRVIQFVELRIIHEETF